MHFSSEENALENGKQKNKIFYKKKKGFSSNNHVRLDTKKYICFLTNCINKTVFRQNKKKHNNFISQCAFS